MAAPAAAAALADAPFAGHLGQDGERRSITAMAIVPRDGSPTVPAQIITAARDGSVLLWDWDTGNRVGSLPRRGSAGVPAVAVIPDGGKIVTAGAEVRIWDPAASDPASSWRAGNGGITLAVAAIARGNANSVITAGDSGSVEIWDLGDVAPDGTPVHRQLVDELGPIYAMAATDDGGRIVTGSSSGTARVWDSDGHPVGVVLAGHTGPIDAVAANGDASRIVTGSRDSTARIWDGAGNPIGAPLTGHEDAICAVACTWDGSRVVTGSLDGTARIWDGTGVPIGEPLIGHKGRVSAVAVTPNDDHVVTAGWDGKILIWDRVTGDPVGGTGVGPVHSSLVAGYTNDEETPVDRLGVAADAHTVAALAAAVGTTPPLSIALLGHWGSGKSSFMRLMIDRIDDLARRARDPRGSFFAANVRQVRFNAWNYSDDQVWVGLVEHLFKVLAATDERQLGTPETVRRRRAELERELAAKHSRRARLARALGDDRAGRKPGGSTVLWTLVSTEVADRWHAWRGRSWWRRAATMVIPATVAGAATWAAMSGAIAALMATIAAAVAGLVAVAKPLSSVLTTVGRSARRAREEVTERAERLDQDVRQIEAELGPLDAARQLADYLRELRDPQRYERYRGLLGHIYRDLERLSDNLARAREQWRRDDREDRPPLQRIVLYVDDLDRCPPEKVVDVLRAIQLMLALPLFVVIVAVDPRWLRQVLDHHHAGLFRSGDGLRGPAPADYLDKIFQVSYALRPVGTRQSAGYLKSLLPSPLSDGDSPAGRRATAPGPANEVERGQEPIQSGPPRDPSGLRHGDASTARAGATNPSLGAPVGSLRPKSMQLEADELGFLPLLGPLMTTPRSLKRLLNLYQLLRIGVAQEASELAMRTGLEREGSERVARTALRDFIGDKESGGPYQAASLLLACVIGRPADARTLLMALRAASADEDENGEDIVGFLRRTGSPWLAERIVAIERAGTPVHRELRSYRDWAREVARFSFATCELFLGDNRQS